jgi:hypothetical protein
VSLCCTVVLETRLEFCISDGQWAAFLNRFAQAIDHLIPHAFSSAKGGQDDSSQNDIKSLQEEAGLMSATVSFPPFVKQPL